MECAAVMIPRGLAARLLRSRQPHGRMLLRRLCLPIGSVIEHHTALRSLGLIHGKIRLMQQLRDPSAAVRTANACADPQSRIFRDADAVYLTVDLQQFLLKVILRHIAENKEKFISAVAHQLVVGTDLRPDGLRR